jgi:hypothetical protein
LRYADGFAVYDSLGRGIGRVEWEYPYFGSVSVVLVIGSGQVVELEAFGDDWKIDRLGFTTPDCTGDAFIPPTPGPDGWSSAAVARPGSTLYVTTGPATVQTMSSWLGPDGACVEDVVGARRAYAPVAPRLNLAEYFVPPFAVRANGVTVPE